MRYIINGVVSMRQDVQISEMYDKLKCDDRVK